MDILKECEKFIISWDNDQDVGKEIFSEEPSEAEPCELVVSRTKKIDEHSGRLMGEANIKYASGNSEEAINLSKEVIRCHPWLPDPFHLLGMIYEDNGQFELSADFFYIAALLTKNSSFQYLSVAEKFLDLNKIDSALKCYDKACKLEQDDKNLWYKKCALMEKAGADERKILDSYRHILAIKNTSDSEAYMKLAKHVIDSYGSLKERDKVKETILSILSINPDMVTISQMILLIDLLFADQQYDQALDLLVKYRGVVLERPSMFDDAALPEENLPDRITIPQDLPVDLKAKLLICLIHLKMSNLIEKVVDNLLLENFDDVCDLFYDIALSFMLENNYSMAETFLAAATKSKSGDLVIVWLKYGECLKCLGKSHEAIKAYTKVLEMAPDNSDAKICLAGLYQFVGDSSSALRVLSTHQESSDIIELHIKKCFVLYNEKRLIEFIDSAVSFLNICYKQVLIPKYRLELLNNRTLSARRFIYNTLKSKLNKNSERPTELTSLLAHAEDIWEVFEKLYLVMSSMKKYEELDKISILVDLCPAFYNNPQRTVDIEFVCLFAGLLNKNALYAYPILRNYLIKVLDCNRAWNLFSQLVSFAQDQRHNRFCIRLAMKYPENMALCVLNGHNALVAGSYKHALGEYFACLKMDPLNPYYHFLIGVTYAHLVSQRFSSHRHMLTIQSCVFFNQYINLRGACQETYYNVGRAMHQIGLTFLAVSYYEKALSCPPSLEDDSIFDLTKEIAYNLYVIYNENKSYEMAAHVVQAYIRI